MHNRTALIAGVTGLVGQQLLKQLLASSFYKQIKVLTRREVDFLFENEKLKLLLVDYDHLEDHKKDLMADDIFCCLGTTMNKAGSKENFKKVDYDYPLQLAEITKENGSSQYHLISSLGADADSKVFYSKVKGEIEEAIKEVNFEALHIYRPSLLLGQRNEYRTGEDAAKIFSKLFNFLFYGPLKKYKPIKSEKVAKAMSLYAASPDQPSVIVHESIALQEF